MAARAEWDMDAFVDALDALDALDAERARLDLNWYDVADLLWQ
ncbi:hypothetical protein [Flexivirga aerilata]|nr:hypothetical protein [Flexivirga aerilata]